MCSSRTSAVRTDACCSTDKPRPSLSLTSRAITPTICRFAPGRNDTRLRRLMSSFESSCSGPRGASISSDDCLVADDLLLRASQGSSFTNAIVAVASPVAALIGADVVLVLVVRSLAGVQPLDRARHIPGRTRPVHERTHIFTRLLIASCHVAVRTHKRDQRQRRHLTRLSKKRHGAPWVNGDAPGAIIVV